MPTVSRKATSVSLRQEPDVKDEIRSRVDQAKSLLTLAEAVQHAIRLWRPDRKPGEKPPEIEHLPSSFAQIRLRNALNDFLRFSGPLHNELGRGYNKLRFKVRDPEYKETPSERIMPVIYSEIYPQTVVAFFTARLFVDKLKALRSPAITATRQQAEATKDLFRHLGRLDDTFELFESWTIDGIKRLEAKAKEL